MAAQTKRVMRDETNPIIGVLTSIRQGSWKFAKRQPIGAIGFVILLIAVIVAILGPWIRPQDPLEIHARALFHKPEWIKGFYLGTDHLGRDNLSRIIIGLKPSLRIAMFGVASGSLIGYFMGIIGGYYGGWIDAVLQRMVEAKLAFPTLVLALALVSVLGTSAWHPNAWILFGIIIGMGAIVVALAFMNEREAGAAMSTLVSMSLIVGIILILLVGLMDDKPFTRSPVFTLEKVAIPIMLIGIPGTSRVVRAVTLANRNAEYVQAARAIGATDFRIMIRHIAPQTFAPVMILITSGLGSAIIIESSLSFLGLGIPPPHPSLGGMLSGQTLTNVEKAPWNAVFPGLVLTMIVFSFNLLGDSLRDHFDPRLRK